MKKGKYNKGLSIKKYTHGKTSGYQVDGYVQDPNDPTKYTRIRRRFSGANAKDDAEGYRLEVTDLAWAEKTKARFRNTKLLIEDEVKIEELIKNLREKLKDDKTEGIDLLSKAVQFFIESPLRAQNEATLRECVDMYMDREEYKKLAKQTKVHYRCNLSHLVETVGDRQLATIGEMEVSDLLDARSDSTWAKQGCYRNWRAFWNWAMRKRFVNDNVVERCDYPTLTAEEAPDGITICSADELEKLFSYADKVNGKSMIPYLALGTFAALRPFEIHRAQWEDITWEDEDGDYDTVMRVRQRKGNKFARNTELPDVCLKWLRYFDPDVENRKGPICKGNTQKHWNLIRACAGFKIAKGSLGSMHKWGLEEDLKGHDGDDRTEWANDQLRHTGITAILKRGAGNGLKRGEMSKAQVAEWAGNSERMIDDHYKGIAKGTQRECDALWAVTPEAVLG